MTETLTSMESSWMGIRFLPRVTMMFLRSFLTICSQVVMAIFIALSITGFIHSWTDFSIA